MTMRKDDLYMVPLMLMVAAGSRPYAYKEPPHEAACEGCEHLWWEHDMGKSIPHCKIGMDMTTPCEEFEANSLYASYIEGFGKEQL